MAAVVHDMRAPLNACLMSLSLVELKAAQPSEVLKAVEVIRRNLARQALLIDDLGDALQIVDGGIELELQDTDLIEVADAAAQAVSAATDVAVGWAGARPAARTVSADPERLERAIGTLLEIVAGGAGPSGRVEFTTTEAGGRMRLEIRCAGGPDSGAKAAAPRRRRAVMRLTVANEIVTRHGGSLEIEDQSATLELPPR